MLSKAYNIFAEKFAKNAVCGQIGLERFIGLRITRTWAQAKCQGAGNDTVKAKRSAFSINISQKEIGTGFWDMYVTTGELELR